MERLWLERIKQLITSRTGLRLPDPESGKLQKILLSRMKLHSLSEPEYYYQYLKAERPESHAEWKELVPFLSTGESYFFRDEGQFTLLKNWILPQLIQEQDRFASLRIWSAGCSTGEEPYSLAILLDKMIPDPERWNIFILGTDLNEDSIEKARQGVYGSWSFRRMDPGRRAHYFRKRGRHWEVDQRIRSMVTFRTGNIITDPFPDFSSGIREMDLILCRNVFIYLDPEVIPVVIGKFADTIKDGGYFLTGHTELQGYPLGGLQAMLFPESVVYRQAGKAEAEIEEGDREAKYPIAPIDEPGGPVPISPGAAEVLERNLSAHAPQDSSVEISGAERLLAQAEALFEAGNYVQATETLERIPEEGPCRFEVLYLGAQLHANLANYRRAIQDCREALKIDPFAVQPYYLLAQIAELQGDSEEAKDLLKRALYLSPSFIPASLELGALYEKEENPGRARRLRKTALELLQALPPGMAVEPYRDVTAGELAQYVQNILKEESKTKI